MKEILGTAVEGYAKKLVNEAVGEKKRILEGGFDGEVKDMTVGLVVEDFEKVFAGVFAEKCKEIVRGGVGERVVLY